MLLPIKKRIPIFELKTKITGLVSAFDSTAKVGKVLSSFIFCGIANPSRFERSVNKNGTAIVGELFYNDHHSYSESDVRTIIERTKFLGVKTAITTEKDAVKLLRYRELFDAAGITLLILQISSEVTPSDKFIDILLNAIKENKPDDR